MEQFLFQANIDNLNIQIDQFESEIEGLQARRKKLDRDASVLFDSFSSLFSNLLYSRNILYKENISKKIHKNIEIILFLISFNKILVTHNLLLQKQDRLEELKNFLERHRFHISKLESIMRMVDNDAIDLDQVRKVRSLREHGVNPFM